MSQRPPRHHHLEEFRLQNQGSYPTICSQSLPLNQLPAEDWAHPSLKNTDLHGLCLGTFGHDTELDSPMNHLYVNCYTHGEKGTALLLDLCIPKLNQLLVENKTFLKAICTEYLQTYPSLCSTQIQNNKSFHHTRVLPVIQRFLRT